MKKVVPVKLASDPLSPKPGTRPRTVFTGPRRSCGTGDTCQAPWVVQTERSGVPPPSRTSEATTVGS